MSKKNAILKAATALFASRGYRDAAMTEVAQMSGTAGANVFYHFKNKEELFLAVLQDVKEGLVRAFDDYFREKAFDTGMERVEGIIDFYLYLAGTHEEWFLLLHRHYLYRLAVENPVCRSHLEEIYRCLVDVFEQAIIIGQADGSIGSVSPRKVALIMLSMVDGIVRFKVNNLYHAGALYDELITCCRRMIENEIT